MYVYDLPQGWSKRNYRGIDEAKGVKSLSILPFQQKTENHLR